MLEEEYRVLESKKRGGPSVKQPAPPVLCIDSSSSDSESMRPLKRQKRCHDNPIVDKLVEMEGLLNTVKSSVDALQEVRQSRHDLLSTVFCCIVCKESALTNEPMVPQCCSGVIVCKQCLQGWFLHSSTCPHCRENITLDRCLPFPSFRPLLTFLQE